MSSRIQMPRPVRAGDQIVALHDHVADRGRRHVQPQRLPVLPIVERDEDFALGAGEEQSLALRILTHGVDRRAGGDAVGDRRPGLAAVMRAEDVRAHVVEPQRVDRGVRGLRVEVSRVDDRHLHERLQLRWSDVVPRRTAVGRCLHETVIGPHPDAVDVER
jgi:hypothetical protein